MFVLLRHSPTPTRVELRLVEARGGVALDAVDESLERADADPVVAESRRDARIRQLVPLVERGTGEYANSELAAPLELRVDGKLNGRRVVVNGGDAKLARCCSAARASRSRWSNVFGAIAGARA